MSNPTPSYSDPIIGFSCLREQVFLRIPDPRPSRPKMGFGLHQRLACRVSALFPNPIKYLGTTLHHPKEWNWESHGIS